jgi:hypothetical protein
MAMHAIPTIMDAVSKKVVRGDMIALLPQLPKKRIPLVAGLDLSATGCAGEPQPSTKRCALRHCRVDLDQHRYFGTAVHQNNSPAFNLAATSTVLTVSEAEAQTVGMERREERRN